MLTRLTRTKLGFYYPYRLLYILCPASCPPLYTTSLFCHETRWICYKYDIASWNSLWETILFHMSSHVHYISYRKSLTIFYEAISVQIQNWLIADLQRSLITVLRMELQGESEIPVSNDLLGNAVGRRLLPSETAVHDRRLLECKIWYDSCLMSSDILQSKYLPSYHSLYCFTQSGYDIQIFEKAKSMDKSRAEIEQKGKRETRCKCPMSLFYLSLP